LIPVISVREITRSLIAVMPGWLMIICGVCLAIPLARLAALLFTAGLCLIQLARVRRAASAWKGLGRAWSGRPSLGAPSEHER
jgi:hypothetical protein